MNTQIFDQICQKTSCDLNPTFESPASQEVNSFSTFLRYLPNQNLVADTPIDFDFQLPFSASTVVVYLKNTTNQINLAANILVPTYPFYNVEVAGTAPGGIPIQDVDNIFMDESKTVSNNTIGKFLVTSNYQEGKRLFNNTSELFPSATSSTLFPYGTGTNVENNADRVLFYPPQLSASASNWPNSRPVTQIGLTYNQFPSPTYSQHCLAGLVETYHTVLSSPELSHQSGYPFGQFQGKNNSNPIVIQAMYLLSPSVLRMRILPLYSKNDVIVFPTTYLQVEKLI